MENFFARSDSQIESVQDFAKVIDGNNIFWDLLRGKEVTRFNQEVKYKVQQWNKQEIKGVKHFDRGKVFSVQTQGLSDIIIEIDYGNKFCVKYNKEVFIEQFNVILPPLSFQMVIELIRREEEKKRLQKERLKSQRREARRRETERQDSLRQEAEQREAEKLETEIQKQKALERDTQKQGLIRSLNDVFRQDFLASDSFYQDKCTQYLSHDEYQAEKSHYVQNWVKLNLGLESDFEQAKAIGAIEGHVQVVARAGSGKTRTLVSRALFLQKHCGVSPHEMLLLAFNKKAANEICDRLTDQLQSSIPHVMTFHALAYALSNSKFRF